MGMRDVEATLPPGFRFYPSDGELVCYYLQKKVANERLSRGTFVEIDLHACEPWELPDVAKLGEEWYFFSFRDRKYATGLRSNRATKSGYWKATGRDKPVINPAISVVVGMRKTLVFYKERAPHGVKTGWVMHEFRLDGPHTTPKVEQEDWVLCRVFCKSKGESSKPTPGVEQDQTIGCWSTTVPHRERCNDSDSLASMGMQRHNFTELPQLVGYASAGMVISARAMEDFRFLLELGSEDQDTVGGLIPPGG